MNKNKETAPLYPRIVDFHPILRCCDEFCAVCPECEGTLCVFCEDECPECEASIF